MNLLQKHHVRYALGVIGVGAILFGIFKAYKTITQTNHPPSILTSDYDNLSEEEKEALSFISRISEHKPYENLIEDDLKQKLGIGKIEEKQNIKDIHYKIILSLMKGNSYQGIVNISFFLNALTDNDDYFKINYNGGGVKYVMINGKELTSLDFKYINHQILIPREFIIEKSKNNIEIIFESLYSFLNYGLSAYFMVDQHQKYSLRQQVIYSINGYLDIQRIIPCINCLNQCKVQIEVIHPDTFNVFSNTSKSLERLCSINQYQKYPFLFDLSSSSLNKSFKLNQSSISSYSGIGQSNGSTFSSINFYNRKRANTHFYKERLPSIHHMFIFSSSMMQLQTNSMNNPLESQLLIRYFCKHTQSKRLQKNVNKIHNYILDIFRRLSSENIKNFINKIDILIIADRQIQGYFAPGVILLSEQSLKQATIDIRCYYLIVRALLGLLQLQKGHNVLTIKQVLELNQLVSFKFQQFRNYLYIKNQKFGHIRSLLNNKEIRNYILKNEGYFLKYFNKQLKYILKDDCHEKISFELHNLMLSFHQEQSELFWQNFIANYNFLSPLIIQPLIKLGMRSIGVPKNQKLLEQLKSCFSHSKYFLNFHTNEEIADNLPKFIEEQCYGLEQRLTQIKVKQKYKDFITQKYEKYLPIRSNTTQAQSMYIQLKKFNENKNFHHISILKSEINRVSYFGLKFVFPQRINIDCSIIGWKLLKKIKLYPEDKQYYELIKTFEALL